MSESEEAKQAREERELEAENIALYKISLTAWFETKMQRDKMLVTLSAAGVGLLVTLLTARGIHHWSEILLYLAAFGSFLFAIWTGLKIFDKNADYIEDGIRGGNTRDPKLKQYDRLIGRAFLTGAICAIVLAAVSAVNQLNSERSAALPDKNRMTDAPMKKSLDGFNTLKPQATQSSETPPPISPAPPSSPPANTNPPANTPANPPAKHD